jgi:ATP phosphoribosyltransferase regulatory subunit HisZ
VGWVSKQDGLLAIDLNGDGQINSGVELFGSSTVLADGTHAKDGWVALAALDSDANGKLDAHDAQFNQLRVWIDANGNGQTEAQELLTLAEHHIASISLTPDGRSIQQNGNVIQGYSTFTNTDGSKHEVADVGLQVHDANVASIDLSVVDHAAAHLDKAHESAYVDLGELLALDNAVSDSAQHYQVYSDAGMNGVQQLIDQTMISVHHVS